MDNLKTFLGGDGSPCMDIDQPRLPIDQEIAMEYFNEGLTPAPSIREVAPVVIGLLGKPETTLRGLSLLYGRQIGVREFGAPDQDHMCLMRSIIGAQTPPEHKFAFLLPTLMADQQCNAPKKRFRRR